MGINDGKEPTQVLLHNGSSQNGVSQLILRDQAQMKQRHLLTNMTNKISGIFDLRKSPEVVVFSRYVGRLTSSFSKNDGYDVMFLTLTNDAASNKAGSNQNTPN